MYHEEEFPKNNLRLVYENDLYSPGEMHPRSPNDLLLITYRRSLNEATYRDFGEINYEREYRNGLAHTLWVRRSRLQPQGELVFEWLNDEVVNRSDALNTAEVGIQLRYSVREAYLSLIHILDLLNEYEEINQKFGLPEYYENEEKMNALFARQAVLQRCV